MAGTRPGRRGTDADEETGIKGPERRDEEETMTGKELDRRAMKKLEH